MTTRRAAAAALLTLSCLAAIAGAGAAGAQVELEPTEVPAGSATILEFTVESGCRSSPTIEVAVTMAEGTFDVVPVAPPGFTTLILDDGRIVVFQGGPLDHETPATFGIRMITPNTPGVTVMYPVEQTCVNGAISWTDPNPDGEGAAPRLRLTANPDPITSTTQPGATTTAPNRPTPTALPPLTDPVSTETVQEGGGGSSGTVRNILLLVLVLGGGYWFIRRRNAARH